MLSKVFLISYIRAYVSICTYVDLSEENFQDLITFTAHLFSFCDDGQTLSFFQENDTTLPVTYGTLAL